MFGLRFKPLLVLVLVLAASLAAYGPGLGVGRGAVGAGAAAGGAAWLTAPLPLISFAETSSYIRLGLKIGRAHV